MAAAVACFAPAASANPTPCVGCSDDDGGICDGLVDTNCTYDVCTTTIVTDEHGTHPKTTCVTSTCTLWIAHAGAVLDTGNCIIG